MWHFRYHPNRSSGLAHFIFIENEYKPVLRGKSNQ